MSNMPPIPSSWKHRTLGTRHVIDRTLGNKICYIQGRYPSANRGIMPYDIKTCTLEEWTDYVVKAERVP